MKGRLTTADELELPGGMLGAVAAIGAALLLFRSTIPSR